MDSGRRDRVLDTAEALFFKHGFRRITADEIASAVGISKKTLYEEFTSKSGIVREVIHRKMVRLRESFSALQRNLEEDNSREPLVDPLYGYFRILAREMFSISQSFLSDLKKYEPGLWEEVHAFRREQVYTRFRQQIEEGQRQGIFRTDVSPLILSELIIALGERLLTPETLYTLNMTPGDIVEHIGSVLSLGVLTDAGRRLHKSVGSRGISGEDTL